MDRRCFLSVSGGALLFNGSAALAQGAGAPVPKLAWHDVKEWGVEGRGWNDTARFYDRFPSRAQKSIPPGVWNLSRHSAGMLVRFETDSPVIHARYSLLNATLALPHMPATGVSGLDLYGRDRQGKDRWLGITRPAARDVDQQIAGDIDRTGTPRLYTLYLPLYNGVDRLEIGVDAGARFDPVAPRLHRPIVFYGTSIMHGACASRTGMAIPAIVGRRLKRPTINLGFSGSGRMEASVGALLAELQPSAYAIDCLPNMTPELVAERTEPLIRQLREARPDVAILMVEDRTFTNARFRQSTRSAHEQRRANFRRAYENLVAAGVKRLSYLKGEDLLGDDGEGATDGSHPNDLGMVRYADAYERSLRRIIED